jgi:opacity protein-like surface antigen
MSKFDEIFENKMKEAQQFAGQKRSWTQLNRDLHAFEIGASGISKSLAIWKALAIVAALGIVGLVLDRQRLVQQMPSPAAPLPSPATVPAAPAPMATLPNQEWIAPQQAVAIAPSTAPSVTSKKDNHTPQAPDKASTPCSNAADVVALEQALQTALQDIARLKQEVAETTQQAAEAIKRADVLTDVILSMTPVRDTAAQLAALKKDSAAVVVPATPVPSPVIDPVRVPKRPFRVGVFAMAGISSPGVKGVSALTGQGVGASFQVWRNVSVTASAAWMQFDISADSIPANCMDVKAPPSGPGHHFPDLKAVASDRSAHHYTLGIQYALPVYKRLTVNANAGHTWVHLPSKIASLRFEDNGPGGPGPGHHDDETIAVRTPKQWSNQTWRIGAGLSYELPRWSLGINGYYAQAKSSTCYGKSAVFASADIMYKF